MNQKLKIGISIGGAILLLAGILLGLFWHPQQNIPEQEISSGEAYMFQTEEQTERNTGLQESDVQSSPEKSTEEKPDERAGTAMSSNAIEGNSGEKSNEAKKPAAQNKQVTVTVRCDKVWENTEKLSAALQKALPRNGTILSKTTVTLQKNDTVYEVLYRVCRQNNIQMEHKRNPITKQEYIAGISNLYEFDCGSASGWLFFVNGKIDSRSASEYVLSGGEEIVWQYTCNSGKDLKS